MMTKGSRFTRPEMMVVQQKVKDPREEYTQICMSTGRYKPFLESAVEPRMAAKRFIYDHYDQK